jgi:solute carrier family 50 protein (sugar transporter)
MGLLNSFFWLVYGISLWDMVIFIPNFCGFLLSVVQLILCFIFSNNVNYDEQLSEQLVEDNSITCDDDSSLVTSRNNNNLEML